MNKGIKKIGFIAIFYLIAISLKYYIIIIKPDFYTDANLLFESILVGLGPLIGALVLVLFFKRPNALEIFKAGYWQTVLVVLIPIVLFALVGLINDEKVNLYAAKIIAISILYAAFEEYGWRGYLQSELGQFKRIYKYLIVSVLWYFWHLEFGFGFSMNHFSVYLIILSGSIGIGYVADKSKSLIYVALFHAFMNMFLTESLNEIPSIQKLIIISISAIAIILQMRFKRKKEKFLAVKL